MARNRLKKVLERGTRPVACVQQPWSAPLPDRCPAYITKERYEAIQRRLPCSSWVGKVL
jgi:hypothetical protein